MGNKGERVFIGLASILLIVVHVISLTIVVRNLWEGHAWRPRAQRYVAVYWLVLLAYMAVATGVHLMLD